MKKKSIEPQWLPLANRAPTGDERCDAVAQAIRFAVEAVVDARTNSERTAAIIEATRRVTIAAGDWFASDAADRRGVYGPSWRAAGGRRVAGHLPRLSEAAQRTRAHVFAAADALMFLIDAQTAKPEDWGLLRRCDACPTYFAATAEDNRHCSSRCRNRKFEPRRGARPDEIATRIADAHERKARSGPVQIPTRINSLAALIDAKRSN